ncbi:MAG: hypothetical protein KY475_01740, partial [Planctomycetes bacterium]|nr:hypothetical protein [Planctomycetota bacterium]
PPFLSRNANMDEQERCDALWRQLKALYVEKTPSQAALSRLLDKDRSFVSRLLNPDEATTKPGPRRKEVNRACETLIGYLTDFVGPPIRVRRDARLGEQLQEVYQPIEFDVVDDTRYFPLVADCMAGRIVEYVQVEAPRRGRWSPTILTPGGPGAYCALEALLNLSLEDWTGVTIGPALEDVCDVFRDNDSYSPRQVVQAAGKIPGVRCDDPRTREDWEALWSKAEVIFMSVGDGKNSFLYKALRERRLAPHKSLKTFAGDVMYLPYDRSGNRLDNPEIREALQTFHPLPDIERRLAAKAKGAFVLLGVDKPAKAQIVSFALFRRLVTRCVVTIAVAESILRCIDKSGRWLAGRPLSVPA